jgi:hypothetical protein
MIVQTATIQMTTSRPGVASRSQTLNRSNFLGSSPGCRIAYTASTSPVVKSRVRMARQLVISWYASLYRMPGRTPSRARATSRPLMATMKLEMSNTPSTNRTEKNARTHCM